ncbi:MAG: transcription termination factor NusA [Actinomycetota bacterium]|nr:transcription termination factor NusA [Actinomycetota bacterium]
MDENLLDALELLEREKGVPADTILDALANALVSAYKRTPGAAEEARVTIDADTAEIIVYGQDLDEDGNVIKEWEDTPDNFGRIAAQTAKQVILQRLRDAKREQVFELYEGREGDLVTGIVQQSDHRYAILDLGNAEAIMPASERIPYEKMERGNRLKAYILEVRGEGKGPQIVVSRSHPEFIRSLFELEVPELVDGDVEIKAIAREAGHRTKIAVLSNDPNVDPVGACVGARGSRVRQVVNELRGEKVDIVEWRPQAAAFLAEALSPARVKEVRLDDELRVATVIVPDHQLSLAIGKEGQNARLAARLTGYKVDIRSESQDLGLIADDAEDRPGTATPAPTPPATETTGAETSAPESPSLAAGDEATTVPEAAPGEVPAGDQVENGEADAAQLDEAATEGMVATEEIVATEDVVATEGTVASDGKQAEEIVATETVATEDMVATEEIVAPEDMEATDGMLAAEEMPATEDMPATEESRASDELVNEAPPAAAADDDDDEDEPVGT